MTDATAKKPINERVLDLFKRAGMNPSEASRAAGYKTPSGVQRYTDPTAKPLHPKAIHRLLKALVGKGTPPITADEVWDLSEIPYVALRPYEMAVVDLIRSHLDGAEDFAKGLLKIAAPGARAPATTPIREPAGKTPPVVVAVAPKSKRRITG